MNPRFDMTENNLPPIPIPPRQRWREFRVVYLPPLTFVALIGIICWMWANYVHPGDIIGEVEMVRANIISPADSTVLRLDVDYLQPVTNGQVLGVVANVDTDTLKAELAAAEADLRLMKARMDLDKTRNLNSYGQLRVSLAENRFSLDIARIRLEHAQSEFERAQKLFDDKIIPRGMDPSLSGGNLISSRNEFGYEVTRRDRTALQAEVAGLEKAVAEIERSVGEMERSGIVHIEPVDGAIEEAIRAQREQINQLQKPQVLRAPIDGFVSEIKIRPGERVAAGGTVLAVSGHSSDRIVAWVHTPVISKPRIGDSVEIRRMGMGQHRFEGRIVQVGSQLEAVSPMLRSPTANPERIEVGLPLLVKSERARELIPGEAVQLRVIKSAPAAAAN
jgi:multidrug resistance efflux pump